MKSTFLHANLNVFDLQKSLAFYDKALGLKEHRRKEAPDGSFILVYLSDGATPFELELTCATAPSPITWATTRSTSPCAWRTRPPRMPCTKKWAASALKTARWTSISSTTPTATGLKSWTVDPTAIGNACSIWGRRFCFQESGGAPKGTTAVKSHPACKSAPMPGAVWKGDTTTQDFFHLDFRPKSPCKICAICK